MIANLKPYPEYKESGLTWLGQVPRHWEMRPAFGVFVPNHERNYGMKERIVLSLSYGRIVIKPAEKLHGLVPESRHIKSSIPATSCSGPPICRMTTLACVSVWCGIGGSSPRPTWLCE
jgi:hypothetical protein